MTEKERMLGGKLYRAFGEELRGDFKKAKRLIAEYNVTTEDEKEKRNKILKELLGGTGENFHIEPPFFCDYGCNIYVGENSYCNYECIVLDVCKVTIGDNVLIGPRVSLYAAGHPIDPVIRTDGLEFGKPITVGNNVWIGGDTTINPGVTIGDNSVIGSGSVVTKDIPANVVAAGNPCRVIREITEDDIKYWEKLRDEYNASLDN